MTQLAIMMLYGLAAFFASLACARKFIPWAEAKFENEVQFISKLNDRQLRKVGSEKLKVRTIIFLSVAVAINFIFVPLWPLKFVTLVPAIFIGFHFQKYFVSWQFKRRQRAFESQFVDGLTLIANAIKSGLSLQQSFEMASHEMQKPFGEEFSHLLAEIKIGVALTDALKKMEARVGSKDLSIVVQAICILRETGGNLIETFQKITSTIRERQKIHGKIRVLTTQGMVQGIIILCMPFALSVLLYFMVPDFIMPLFTKPLGIILIFIALILQTIGAILMKKIVMIKV